jgi:hypothetical protein
MESASYCSRCAENLLELPWAALATASRGSARPAADYA